MNLEKSLLAIQEIKSRLLTMPFGNDKRVGDAIKYAKGFEIMLELAEELESEIARGLISTSLADGGASQTSIDGRKDATPGQDE